jgi:hypothetical protein
MSKALATTKYFRHPIYALTPQLVNKDVTAAIGVNFGLHGSYDNALGRFLIERQLGKRVFTLLADLDPEVARFQIDKNLP